MSILVLDRGYIASVETNDALEETTTQRRKLCILKIIWIKGYTSNCVKEI